jgi:hypothetical protein
VASADMKAVITLTADASGVSVGVSKAMKSLENLQAGVSQLRSLAVAGMLANVFRGLADGAMSELKRLEDLGRTYSPEGMAAANQLAIAQQQSDQTLGQAFGPITAAIDQMKVQAIKDLTDYLVANKEPIGQAMAALAGFTVGLAEMTAQTLVAFGNLVDWISNTTLEQKAKEIAIAGGETLMGGGNMALGSANITAIGLIYDVLKSKLGGD